MRILYEPDDKDPTGSSPPADADAPQDDKQQIDASSADDNQQPSPDDRESSLADIIGKTQEKASKAETDAEGAEASRVVPEQDKTAEGDKKEPSPEDKEKEELPPFHE